MNHTDKELTLNNELSTWTNDTKIALESAGFTVTLWEGFPLVQVPDDLAEKVRLLKLILPHGGCKRIYAEGMLVTP